MQKQNDEDPIKIYAEWKERATIRPGLTEGLLAPYWDELAVTLFGQGYTWYTVRRTIEIAKPFAAFAQGHGIRSIANLTSEIIDSYLTHRKRREGPSCIRLLLGFLQDKGILNRIAPSKPASPVIIEEYQEFLRRHRGVGERTIQAHISHVQAFLTDLGEQADRSRIKDLAAPQISRFIEKQAALLTSSERKKMCAALRGLLRFLVLRSYLRVDLTSSVPVIPTFRLAGIPQALPKDDIEKILGAVDRSTPVGRRDFAMFLILATYGIRGGQLCSLMLEDIGWRRETLRVRAAKGGRETILPLLDPVAEALIDYLRHGRPRVAHRQVFLRVRPPLGPLGGSLGQIIKPYARRAGVKATRVSPRTWRHGFASKMLAHGQALKNISDIMGHRSVETTYIYTKVDIEMLGQAALDWPEDAQ